MKNKIVFIITLLVFGLSASSVLANEESFFGIGAELFQDPFNKKIIITKVFANSPAEKAGITAGTEIISVNGEKVRKMPCLCQVVTNIRGEEGATVKLVIKRKWWERTTVELIREKITFPIPKENPELEKYWKQVAPIDFAYASYFEKEVSDKLSLRYKRKILPNNNYWQERRQKFELGYNTCMGYSKNYKESCLINLLNRENQITLTDRKLFEFLRYIPKK